MGEREEADSVPELFDAVDDFPQGLVVGEELDLARTVEEDVVI